MRKLIKITIFGLLLMGCANTNNQNEQLKIVTTLFPQYDIARAITKDKAEVSMILPPGVEAHSYEPTPQDIVKLDNSDMFIYTSNHLETYAEKMAQGLKEENSVIINLEDSITIKGEDPHFWLSVKNMLAMSQVILDEIVLLDPDNRDYYLSNAKDYMDDLKLLEAELFDLFANVDDQAIVFAGHFSFDYFAEEYGLNYLSTFESFSPNAEASAKQVAKLIDYINDQNIEYIYFEELVDPKLGRMLANETGAELLMLNAEHNITKEQAEAGISYADIMRMNIENLKLGLNYE
ncbi:MAG: zinc ABC transporter substrate-binding protein [Erysipelothrix sp.]|nr:zinc ABC transporter substrate-binding protein [Erysipelothrix sp.]